MYTKEYLIDELHRMGVRPDDTIMIHSSMKSIGEVQGGADTVLDAFMEYFAEGLLLLPTHTWAQMKGDYNVYDPAKEPACVGILPNLFMRRPGVVRSLHPTHSIAAYGKEAEEYVRLDETATTPCPEGGCYDMLRHRGGKVLLIGVTQARNTYIHSIDEVFDVKERLAEEPRRMFVVLPDGSKKEVHMHPHYNPVCAHISENFVKLDEVFYALGAAKKVHFGDAECTLCDCKMMFEIYSRILKMEENCLIEQESIPRQWWDYQNFLL